jgi:methanogenic corrinoid protein MtbC1
LSEIEQRLQHLTNVVLAGKAVEARQGTYAALGRGSTVNDIIDAIVEAVNISVDLSELEQVDQTRLTATEEAVNACLTALEEHLASSEKRFGVKATVGPVALKAGNLLSMGLSAALRSAGFRAVSLSKTQTPLELLRNSEELGAELVVPLLSGEGVEAHLKTFAEECERGGFKAKFKVIPLTPALPATVQSPFDIARNSGEAISKATEWALKKQMSERHDDEEGQE